MAKFRVPCITCEGGFHEVDEADLKKFTHNIHNPTQELEKVAVREIDNPELATKVKEFEARVKMLETDLAKERDTLPVDRMMTHWDHVLKHIEECPSCKPLFEEKVVKPITEKARENYTPKPAEPEKPTVPDRTTWLLEEASKRRVRGSVGRRELEREFDEKFKEAK